MLFDDPTEDEIIEAADSGGILVVPAQVPAEMLEAVEREYRMNGRPPVLFVDLDENENEVVGNPGQIAAYFGVSAIGLTVDIAEALMTANG